MYLYFHLYLDLHLYLYLYLYLYFSAGSELCHPVPPSVLLYLRSALQFTNLTAMQCICISIWIWICICICICISLPAVNYVIRCPPLFFFICALPCNLPIWRQCNVFVFVFPFVFGFPFIFLCRQWTMSPGALCSSLSSLCPAIWKCLIQCLGIRSTKQQKLQFVIYVELNSNTNF